MRRIFVFVSIFVLAACTVYFGVVFGKHKNLNIRNLPENIILGNPKLGGAFVEGLIVYDFKNQTQQSILNGVYISDPYFGANGRILMVQQDKEIIEYDLDGKSSKKIFISNEHVELPKYVPNSNSITYSNGHELYIYDMTTQKNSKITDLRGDYSWNNSGKDFLFCYKYNDAVYKYDFTNNTIDRLFSGHNPQYSNNNQYISYVVSDEKSDYIVVRELTSQKEWRYKARGVRYHRFSSDDRYIAFQKDIEKFLAEDSELVVWDFKSGETGNLINFIHHGKCGAFDWMRK